MNCIYENREMTLEEIYQTEYAPKDIDAFAGWLITNLDQGIIQISLPGEAKGKTQYINQRLNDRKKKIRELVQVHYTSTIRETDKKKRKVLMNAYKNSEQFVLDFEKAYREDTLIADLADEAKSDKIYEEYLLNRRKSEINKLTKRIDEFCDRKREEILQEMISVDTFYDYKSDLILLFRELFSDYLCTEERIVYSCYDYYLQKIEVKSEEDLEVYLVDLEENLEMHLAELLGEDTFIDQYLIDYFFRTIPELKLHENQTVWMNVFWNLFEDNLSDYKIELLEDLGISGLFVLENLMKNPFYQEMAEKLLKRKRAEKDPEYISREELAAIQKADNDRKRMLGRTILSYIPKEYKDFYPLTRKCKRRFYLYIGPTNSGKTYRAVNALMESGSGIYLAPLRLLAYEQFEHLNKEGCLCSLITGEEKTLIPGAVFQSSTIEMADLSLHYPAAVIDEAQMLSDRERGGAWTSAILGLNADKIYICAAPYAKDILIRLIMECGDEYEVITCMRSTKLSCERDTFEFPRDVRDKDSLIVFSKKNVHAVASELQSKGKKCSIIYGNLPYDVRQNEARKFLEGETEVIVSTDAIGMGMNLPIRRVIFLETSKFDGRKKRFLKQEEIQQIAGRAGRKGMHDTGYVNVEGTKKLIKNALNAEIPQITDAVISFPESLLGIDGLLSETLERWNDLCSNHGYLKEDVSKQILLCRELETYTDDKYLIFDFISIPFDLENNRLLQIWRTFFQDELSGKDYNYKRFLPELYEDTHSQYLDTLEEDYKICDLLYFYMNRFHGDADFDDILQQKKKISSQIMKILSRQKLPIRKCRECGGILRWNHPYPICEMCYQMRNHRYYDQDPMWW